MLSFHETNLWKFEKPISTAQVFSKLYSELVSSKSMRKGLLIVY